MAYWLTHSGVYVPCRAGLNTYVNLTLCDWIYFCLSTRHNVRATFCETFTNCSSQKTKQNKNKRDFNTRTLLVDIIKKQLNNAWCQNVDRCECFNFVFSFSCLSTSNKMELRRKILCKNGLFMWNNGVEMGRGRSEFVLDIRQDACASYYGEAIIRNRKSLAITRMRYIGYIYTWTCV